MLAACIELFGSHTGGFAFLRNQAAVIIFTSYIASYSIRIYIMNYYKNTRPKGLPLDNKGFFGLEQISASITMVLMFGLVAVVFLARAERRRAEELKLAHEI